MEGQRRSSRRASLLDEMEEVAKEQAMQDLVQQFGAYDDDEDDEDDVNNNNEENGGENEGLRSSLYRENTRVEILDVFSDSTSGHEETEGSDGNVEIAEAEHIAMMQMQQNNNHIIYEEVNSDDEEAGVISGMTALDPLYEDDGEGSDDGSADFEQLFMAAGAATQTTPRVTSEADAAAYYQYDQDLTTGNYNNEARGDNPPPGVYARRSGSFQAIRQSVHSNDSGNSEQLSVSSLPNVPVTVNEEEENSRIMRSRRVGGSGSEMSRSMSKRRSNVGYRQSIRATVVPGVIDGLSLGRDSDGSATDSPGGKHGRPARLMSRNVGFLTSRRSSNRSSVINDNSSVNSGSNASGGFDIAIAVDRLNSSVNAMESNNSSSADGTGANAAWDQTLAAAAIVAASTNAPGNKRKTKQYSTGEHVLVMLNLLNVQNRHDDPIDFTISPVNELGYPVGAGKTDAQKKGPFNLLICTVTVVHFDEDERYYTIRRADTGSEQRADPSVMSPISDEAAIHAAVKAAKRTRRHEAELSTRNGLPNSGGPVQRCMRSIRVWPVHFYNKKVVPFYQRARARIKVVSAHLLQGDTGYAFKLRLTGINFFVACSFVYLFNDVFTLAFLSSDWDYVSAVIGLCVWVILLLELLFEGLIRPENYRDLKNSEQAYSPSTARSINAFHLCFESAALLLYLPQFPCVFDKDRCGDDTFFGGVYASTLAVTSDKWYEASFGRIILGLSFLRVFGLVRHWKQMWLNNIFVNDNSNSQVVRRLLLFGTGVQKNQKRTFFSRRKKNVEADSDDDSVEEKTKNGNDEDQDLKNAANIGTALMIVNSHRALVLLLIICVIFPAILAIRSGNYAGKNALLLLGANNLAANTTDECDYLLNAVQSWLVVASQPHSPQRYLLGSDSVIGVVWAQLLPVRCSWQRSDGVITDCDYVDIGNTVACNTWDDSPPPEVASEQYFADVLGIRVGELETFESTTVADFETPGNSTVYYVKSINDFSDTIVSTFRCLFLLQVTMLIGVLFGLTVMRGDAGRLVLDPLQRMLKIVVRYAKNPLSQSLSGKKDASFRDSTKRKSREGSAEQLGSYETDQLINAIAKIADLLRKCWGVAGAGIISSNLARTKDGKINATVPGKRVYALFGFVAIREFDTLLRALERDVMVLINDVARVVHDEVYRWSLGDSGQCNKNLGAAFLMVFRIGDFSEVHDRKKRATDVVFNSNIKNRQNVKIKKRRGSGSHSRGGSGSRRPTMTKFELGTNGTLQLASLPGIQQFSDRALLSLLKSYAGILRDEKMVRWNKDFRLGAGVGAFSVSIIYGMDAGWAVEGAVGSMYKIDATYLSPHVNMASRMMSASKQYGVTILLSQAVEELLSKPAQSKLRHLDTVIVKGASRPQKIFTYDARSEGADFFLFDRPKEQADVDAEAYTAAVWETDQDLRAMRQHVSDQFMEKFKKGVDLYISGEWQLAVQVLKEADNIMIQTVIEEGYVETDISDIGDEIYDTQSKDEEIIRLRSQFGDGACKNLISYMERRNQVPPTNWNGFRALMSK